MPSIVVDGKGYRKIERQEGDGFQHAPFYVFPPPSSRWALHGNVRTSFSSRMVCMSEDNAPGPPRRDVGGCVGGESGSESS